MSSHPRERLHVQQAYSFELGKCTREDVRARQLQALANIDADLCAGVARGLGLPAPEPTIDVADTETSGALSHVGKSWPVDGLVVGIVVDHATPGSTVGRLVADGHQAGMSPVLVAPPGGFLADGSPVDRMFLTARSVEYDAVILAAAPQPGPDAHPDLDGKAGAVVPPDAAGIDPRLVLLLQETYRQAKAIVLAGPGVGCLAAAGLPTAGPGIVEADVEIAVTEVVGLVANHRVWERFGSPAAP
ncbi:catalase-related domain-containing protein [Arthrobacter sp. KK5.5]|uniref:catalase-related domain-containing protein n=1 Tax=Arthrobacter sp. KK5.5 TaxID=3373084 RepID=UPI003EE5FBB7